MFDFAEIFITALLRKGVKPGSILAQLPAKPPATIIYEGTPEILYQNQPGFSVLIITDNDLSYSWAHELAERYDILVVYYNHAHFIT